MGLIKLLESNWIETNWPTWQNMNTISMKIARSSVGMYKMTQVVSNGDLTGPEKHRLFRAVNLTTLFPLIPRIRDSEFMVNILQHNYDTKFSMLQWLLKLKLGWEIFACSTEPNMSLCMFMQWLCTCLSSLSYMETSLSLLTEQGLENSMTLLQSTIFTVLTTKIKRWTLQQSILKRNRLENLDLDGYQRTKKKCTCTRCGQAGHNKCNCLTELQVNMLFLISGKHSMLVTVFQRHEIYATSLFPVQSMVCIFHACIPCFVGCPCIMHFYRLFSMASGQFKVRY